MLASIQSAGVGQARTESLNFLLNCAGEYLTETTETSFPELRDTVGSRWSLLVWTSQSSGPLNTKLEMMSETINFVPGTLHVTLYLVDKW